jgi:DNA (cytosine-5)-methyltransferase 1
MDYIERINDLLRPTTDENFDFTVLDLFAGCGGLSLGFEALGFKTIGYEMNKDACETYNANLNGLCHCEFLEVGHKYPKADIVIGGPPCQPFSVGGSQMGLKDSRDGFPVFIDTVKRINPKFFLFENVRGMLYKNRWYLEQIIDALEELNYTVEYRMLNAKFYDVPQNRERIFVVGYRGEFFYPKKLNQMITAGDALKELVTKTPPESRFLNKSMDAYIAKYEKASDCINPRDLYLDRPARTLTCRNLAGATGDMHRIKLKDGRRRRILIREAARLQSFPEWFRFKGNETSIFNQIGNAVPPMLAYNLALQIKQHLLDNSTGIKVRKREKQLQIFPQQ